MEAPKDELYSLAFYIAWKISRKQNSIANFLDKKAKKFVEKSLDAKLIRPIFSKKMDPGIANPIIKEFRSILEDFKFEDKQVKAWVHKPFGIENFCVEHRGDRVIGQFRLTFNVLDKTRSNYDRILPIILKRILKIRIETDKALLSITDYRTPGQVKINDNLWPKGADTVF